MAAKKPKTDRAPITAAQRKQILDLYVYGLAEAPEIAEALNLDLRAVRPAVRPMLAVRRRLWGSPEVQAQTEQRTREMAERRGRMETKCAQLAEVRIDAQTDVACKLKVQAAAADKPEEVRAVARALGPASQDVTSGRLAVGLPNQVTQINDGDDETKKRREEFWKTLHAKVVECNPAEAASGDAGRVLPLCQVDPEQVAAKGGG